MIRLHYIIQVVCLLVFGQGACLAQTLPSNLSACGNGHVLRTLDGSTLILTDDQHVELSAVKAPELWPSGSPHKNWPYSGQSKKRLDQLARGQKIDLFCEGETKTYTGDKIAHVVLPDGRWLQHVLVSEGSVYVFPRARHTSGNDMLYAAELRARKRSAGLWNANRETLKTSNEPIPSGWFQIVSGEVISVGKGKDRTYLNFGLNWREDFTVEIPRAAEKVFAASSIDPTQWQGKTIEARGWIDWKGGPRLVVDGPGQIRLLD